MTSSSEKRKRRRKKIESSRKRDSKKRRKFYLKLCKRLQRELKRSRPSTSSDSSKLSDDSSDSSKLSDDSSDSSKLLDDSSDSSGSLRSFSIDLSSDSSTRSRSSSFERDDEDRSGSSSRPNVRTKSRKSNNRIKYRKMEDGSRRLTLNIRRGRRRRSGVKKLKIEDFEKSESDRESMKAEKMLAKREIDMERDESEETSDDETNRQTERSSREKIKTDEDEKMLAKKARTAERDDSEETSDAEMNRHNEKSTNKRIDTDESRKSLTSEKPCNQKKTDTVQESSCHNEFTKTVTSDVNKFVVVKNIFAKENANDDRCATSASIAQAAIPIDEKSLTNICEKIPLNIRKIDGLLDDDTSSEEEVDVAGKVLRVNIVDEKKITDDNDRSASSRSVRDISDTVNVDDKCATSPSTAQAAIPIDDKSLTDVCKKVPRDIRKIDGLLDDDTSSEEEGVVTDKVLPVNILDEKKITDDNDRSGSSRYAKDISDTVNVHAPSSDRHNDSEVILIVKNIYARNSNVNIDEEKKTDSEASGGHISHDAKPAGRSLCAVARKSYSVKNIHERLDKKAQELESHNEKTNESTPESSDAAEAKNGEHSSESESQSHRIVATKSYAMRKIRKKFEKKSQSPMTLDDEKNKSSPDNANAPVEECSITHCRVVQKSSVETDGTASNDDEYVVPRFSKCSGFILHDDEKSKISPTKEFSRRKIRKRNDTGGSSSEVLESEEDESAKDSRDFKKLKLSPANSASQFPATEYPGGKITVQSIVTLSRKVITVHTESAEEIGIKSANDERRSLTAISSDDDRKKNLSIENFALESRSFDKSHTDIPKKDRDIGDKNDTGMNIETTDLFGSTSEIGPDEFPIDKKIEDARRDEESGTEIVDRDEKISEDQNSSCTEKIMQIDSEKKKIEDLQIGIEDSVDEEESLDRKLATTSSFPSSEKICKIGNISETDLISKNDESLPTVGNEETDKFISIEDEADRDDETKIDKSNRSTSDETLPIATVEKGAALDDGSVPTAEVITERITDGVSPISSAIETDWIVGYAENVAQSIIDEIFPISATEKKSAKICRETSDAEDVKSGTVEDEADRDDETEIDKSNRSTSDETLPIATVEKGAALDDESVPTTEIITERITDEVLPISSAIETDRIVGYAENVAQSTIDEILPISATEEKSVKIGHERSDAENVKSGTVEPRVTSDDLKNDNRSLTKNTEDSSKNKISPTSPDLETAKKMIREVLSFDEKSTIGDESATEKTADHDLSVSKGEETRFFSLMEDSDEGSSHGGADLTLKETDSSIVTDEYASMMENIVEYDDVPKPNNADFSPTVNTEKVDKNNIESTELLNESTDSDGLSEEFAIIRCDTDGEILTDEAETEEDQDSSIAPTNDPQKGSSVEVPKSAEDLAGEKLNTSSEETKNNPTVDRPSTEAADDQKKSMSIFAMIKRFFEPDEDKDTDRAKESESEKPKSNEIDSGSRCSPEENLSIEIDETGERDLPLEIDDVGENKSMIRDESDSQISDDKQSDSSGEVFSVENLSTIDQTENREPVRKIDEAGENTTTMNCDESDLQTSADKRSDSTETVLQVENSSTIDQTENREPTRKTEEAEENTTAMNCDESDLQMSADKRSDSTETVLQVENSSMIHQTENREPTRKIDEAEENTTTMNCDESDSQTSADKQSDSAETVLQVENSSTIDQTENREPTRKIDETEENTTTMNCDESDSQTSADKQSDSTEILLQVENSSTIDQPENREPTRKTDEAEENTTTMNCDESDLQTSEDKKSNSAETVHQVENSSTIDQPENREPTRKIDEVEENTTAINCDESDSQTSADKQSDSAETVLQVENSSTIDQPENREPTRKIDEVEENTTAINCDESDSQTSADKQSDSAETVLQVENSSTIDQPENLEPTRKTDEAEENTTAMSCDESENEMSDCEKSDPTRDVRPADVPPAIGKTENNDPARKIDETERKSMNCGESEIEASDSEKSDVTSGVLLIDDPSIFEEADIGPKRKIDETSENESVNREISENQRSLSVDVCPVKDTSTIDETEDIEPTLKIDELDTPKIVNNDEIDRTTRINDTDELSLADRSTNIDKSSSSEFAGVSGTVIDTEIDNRVEKSQSSLPTIHDTEEIDETSKIDGSSIDPIDSRISEEAEKSSSSGKIETSRKLPSSIVEKDWTTEMENGLDEKVEDNLTKKYLEDVGTNFPTARPLSRELKAHMSENSLARDRRYVKTQQLLVAALAALGRVATLVTEIADKNSSSSSLETTINDVGRMLASLHHRSCAERSSHIVPELGALLGAVADKTLVDDILFAKFDRDDREIGNDFNENSGEPSIGQSILKTVVESSLAARQSSEKSAIDELEKNAQNCSVEKIGGEKKSSEETEQEGDTPMELSSVGEIEKSRSKDTRENSEETDPNEEIGWRSLSLPIERSKSPEKNSRSPSSFSGLSGISGDFLEEIDKGKDEKTDDENCDRDDSSVVEIGSSESPIEISNEAPAEPDGPIVDLSSRETNDKSTKSETEKTEHEKMDFEDSRATKIGSSESPIEISEETPTVPNESIVDVLIRAMECVESTKIDDSRSATKKSDKIGVAENEKMKDEKMDFEDSRTTEIGSSESPIEILEEIPVEPGESISDICQVIEEKSEKSDDQLDECIVTFAKTVRTSARELAPKNSDARLETPSNPVVEEKQKIAEKSQIKVKNFALEKQDFTRDSSIVSSEEPEESNECVVTFSRTAPSSAPREPENYGATSSKTATRSDSSLEKINDWNPKKSHPATSQSNESRFFVLRGSFDGQTDEKKITEGTSTMFDDIGSVNWPVYQQQFVPATNSLAYARSINELLQARSTTSEGKKSIESAIGSNAVNTVQTGSEPVRTAKTDSKRNSRARSQECKSSSEYSSTSVRTTSNNYKRVSDTFGRVRKESVEYPKTARDLRQRVDYLPSSQPTTSDRSDQFGQHQSHAVNAVQTGSEPVRTAKTDSKRNSRAQSQECKSSSEYSGTSIRTTSDNYKRVSDTFGRVWKEAVEYPKAAQELRQRVDYLPSSQPTTSDRSNQFGQLLGGPSTTRRGSTDSKKKSEEFSREGRSSSSRSDSYRTTSGQHQTGFGQLSSVQVEPRQRPEKKFPDGRSSLSRSECATTNPLTGSDKYEHRFGQLSTLRNVPAEISQRSVQDRRSEYFPLPILPIGSSSAIDGDHGYSVRDRRGPVRASPRPSISSRSAPVDRPRSVQDQPPIVPRSSEVWQRENTGQGSGASSRGRISNRRRVETTSISRNVSRSSIVSERLNTRLSGSQGLTTSEFVVEYPLMQSMYQTMPGRSEELEAASSTKTDRPRSTSDKDSARK